MKPYIVDTVSIHFRQGTLPAQWMTVFAALGIYVNVTNNKRYPYSVEISESEFLSAVELAEGL